MTMVYSSRILIERVLRDKVRRLGNVTIREGVSVAGRDGGGVSRAGGVTGVCLSTATGGDERGRRRPRRRRDGPGLVGVRLARGGRLAAAAGADLDAKVTYTSRWYDLPGPRRPPRVLVVAAHRDHADAGQGRAPARARVPGQLLPHRGQPGDRLHGVVGY